MTNSFEQLRQINQPDVRLKIRAGSYSGHTSGLADGFLQANLVILDQSYASDFKKFCQLNPKACPLVGVTDTGSPYMHTLGHDIDIRTDRRRPYLFLEPLLFPLSAVLLFVRLLRYLYCLSSQKDQEKKQRPLLHFQLRILAEHICAVETGRRRAVAYLKLTSWLYCVLPFLTLLIFFSSPLRTSHYFFLASFLFTNSFKYLTPLPL